MLGWQWIHFSFTTESMWKYVFCLLIFICCYTCLFVFLILSVDWMAFGAGPLLVTAVSTLSPLYIHGIVLAVMNCTSMDILALCRMLYSNYIFFNLIIFCLHQTITWLDLFFCIGKCFLPGSTWSFHVLSQEWSACWTDSECLCTLKKIRIYMQLCLGEQYFKVCFTNNSKILKPP